MFRTSFEFSTLGDELISRIASTFVLTMLLGQAGIAEKYTIADLGLLPGGAFSEGLGIDQSGQVTGAADEANFVIHAFLYSNGRMLDLETLPGQSSYDAARQSTAVMNRAQNNVILQLLSKRYPHAGLAEITTGGKCVTIPTSELLPDPHAWRGTQERKSRLALQ